MHIPDDFTIYVDGNLCERADDAATYQDKRSHYTDTEWRSLEYAYLVMFHRGNPKAYYVWAPYRYDGSGRWVRVYLHGYLNVPKEVEVIRSGEDVATALASSDPDQWYYNTKLGVLEQWRANTIVARHTWAPYVKAGIGAWVLLHMS